MTCRECNGEGNVCTETRLPWSLCYCWWCEQGRLTRVTCLQCKGSGDIPGPMDPD